MQSAAGADTFPLIARYPALAALPRAPLATLPTPVEPVPGLGSELWVKRDDLDSPLVAGNKVRSLEFLLGAVRPGDTVLTVGSVGSTHALATTEHAHALGARAVVVLWRQEMNPGAEIVASRLAGEADERHVHRSAVTAMVAATVIRVARRGSLRWVPAGGTSPLGMLGHVNAGLELAAQVERGDAPRPARIVVPLGTGGTAAGLALGLAIAGMPVPLVCARVVPRIVARRGRLVALARDTARFIERLTGARVPRVRRRAFDVVHDVYGGAYGRVCVAATEAAARFPVRLDDTYSAKACAAAVARCGGGPTLFWLTFDPRVLGGGIP